MDAIFRIMAGLIEQPWLAAVPGLGFFTLYRISRRPLVLAAALAWLIYLPYEYAMKLRILCPGECNIRIDLLVLYPGLLLLSLVGGVAFVRARGKQRP